MDVCRLGLKWTWKEFRNPTKKPACTGAAHFAQVESLSFLTLPLSAKQYIILITLEAIIGTW